MSPNQFWGTFESTDRNLAVRGCSSARTIHAHAAWLRVDGNQGLAPPWNWKLHALFFYLPLELAHGVNGRLNRDEAVLVWGFPSKLEGRPREAPPHVRQLFALRLKGPRYGTWPQVWHLAWALLRPVRVSPSPTFDIVRDRRPDG